MKIMKIRNLVMSCLFCGLFAFNSIAQETKTMETKDITVVLVHGAWGDGSHWNDVVPILLKEGYKVRTAQIPLTSSEADITAVANLVDNQEGKVLLVGHSYAGMVISEVGNNDKVKGLVYIAAFAPVKGESMGAIFGRRDPAPGGAAMYPDERGYLWLNYDQYTSAFCQNLDTDKGMLLSLSQKPFNSAIMGVEAGEPAWNSKPCWYQINNEDRMLPTATQVELAERMNATILRLETGHASMAEKPQEVAQFILEAAASL